jgi:hypothetical protein
MKRNYATDWPCFDRERTNQLPSPTEAFGEEYSVLTSGLIGHLLENGYQLFDSGTTTAPSPANEL